MSVCAVYVKNWCYAHGRHVYEVRCFQEVLYTGMTSDGKLLAVSTVSRSNEVRVKA